VETQFQLFTSPANESKYMSAYAATLEEWPVTFDSIDVTNQYGRIHVISRGSKSSIPLILLHAGYASSTMWFPNILELSRNNRVFAVDTIGEPVKVFPPNQFPAKRKWQIGW
jgi:hypothetical protein